MTSQTYRTRIKQWFSRAPWFGDARLFVLFSLTFLFTGLSLLQLGLVVDALSFGWFAPLFVLMLCSSAVVLILQLRGRVGDPVLLALTYFLSGLGLVLIARLAPNFLTRQLFWLAIASLVLTGLVLVPRNLNVLRRYKYLWLGGGLLLLATTLVYGVNPSGFGPRLWLNLGVFYAQPSEPLKLFLVVFLAGYLASHHRNLAEARTYFGPWAVPHPSYFGPMLLMWGLSMVLLVWQRDLGAALLFFGTFLGMLYAATGQDRYIWAGSLLLMIVGVIGYNLFDLVQLRIDAFLNPWPEASGRAYQIVQGLLAFASGGLFGQGLGQGLPTVIPVVHTDFVFAAIGEEYGLLGALAVLVCFALLVGRAFHIALKAADPFSQMLAVGIGTLLGLQTLVITAGTLKLMPLTGVTLPFVSYGGSSLVTSFAMIGLLLFIANQAKTQSMEQQTPKSEPRMRRTPLLYMAWGFLGSFVVVAAGLILWQVVAAPLLVNRADNPRPIVAEQRIERGRLLTVDGVTIAETQLDANGVGRRVYPHANLAAVTGYYSLRHGASGAEAIFDETLRGTSERTPEESNLDELLHRPLVGDDVMLTVDFAAQTTAGESLDGYEGAMVVLDIESGAIRVMASQPTYDPNRLNAQWDALRQDAGAPLLNRATQGLFPVGTVARLVGLVGLYNAGATLPAEPMQAPLEELLAPLGELGYLGTAHQLRLTRGFTALPSQPGRLPDFDDNGTVRDLAVTPLHLAQMVAALETGGQMPRPVLSADAPREHIPAFGPRPAEQVRALLPAVDAGVVGFIGEASPLETGQAWLSWFVGLTPAEPISVAPAPTILPFDPAQAPTAPTPTPTRERPRARYAIVTVVVTAEQDSQAAWRLTGGVIRALAE